MEDLRRRPSAVGELDDLVVQVGLIGGMVLCLWKMSLVLEVSMSSVNELLGLKIDICFSSLLGLFLLKSGIFGFGCS